MDIYDKASELSVPGLIDFGHTDTRPLTPDEFQRLIAHLTDTEMPVPDALRAAWRTRLEQLAEINDLIELLDMPTTRLLAHEQQRLRRQAREQAAAKLN